MTRICIARWFRDIERYTVSDFARAMEMVDRINAMSLWCSATLTPGGYRFELQAGSRAIYIDDPAEAVLFRLHFDL